MFIIKIIQKPMSATLASEEKPTEQSLQPYIFAKLSYLQLLLFDLTNFTDFTVGNIKGRQREVTNAKEKKI